MDEARRLIPRLATLLAVLAGGGPPTRAAPASWPADGAVRFTVDIRSPPSDPCAGIVAVLPNGGILPPNGGCLVQDEAGAELKHECVWANPREGMAIVFEAPKTGKQAWITFSNTGVLNVPRGPSAFCAGLFLYSEFREGQLGEARLIAKDSPAGKTARFTPIDFIGQRDNPLGPDDHFLSYYSGWLKPPKAGDFYLATISDDGSEVHVDGKLLVAWPGVHKRDAGKHGEFGKEIALAGPRHRVEYFHFEQTDAQEANLVWRGPGVSDYKGLPVTVEPGGFTRSGRAEVTAVDGKNARPVAVIDATPLKYLWFGDQPANLFKLTAAKSLSATDKTTYTWALPNGGRAEGAEALWIAEGGRPFEVGLTVSSGPLKSSARLPVYLEHSPPVASIESADDRRLFRQALLQRCRGVVAPKRPCQEWSRDLWALCVNLFEPREGLDLLQEIFTRSRQDMATLDRGERARLETLFFTALRRSDIPSALEWAEKFQKDESDNLRRFTWAMARADLLIYDLNQPAAARTLLNTLQDAANAAGGESAARLLVRQGDIDRLAGKTDAARQWYTKSLERWQLARKSTPAAARDRDSPQPAGHAADWRSDSVQAATYYKNVKDLIGKGYTLEAQAMLEEWEVRFPFTKLSGEFARAEADFAVHAGDDARAARVLKAYRTSVDITNFLPDAMALEMECLVRLKRLDEAKAVAQDIVKRFPTHPVAEAARKRL